MKTSKLPCSDTRAFSATILKSHPTFKVTVFQNQTQMILIDSFYRAVQNNLKMKDDTVNKFVCNLLH